MRELANIPTEDPKWVLVGGAGGQGGGACPVHPWHASTLGVLRWLAACGSVQGLSAPWVVLPWYLMM